MRFNVLMKQQHIKTDFSGVNMLFQLHRKLGMELGKDLNRKFYF